MTLAMHESPITPETRLLVIAPHPDDETIATGLLVQRVQAAGGSVDILLLTDGDNNPWPQRLLERRLRIGAAERARWARRRRDEMLRAMQNLGVPRERLHALGWPDLGLVTALLQSHSSVVQTVASRIAELRPNLLVIPSLADRHPDHGTAHVIARLAAAGANPPPTQWAYRVHAVKPTGKTLAISGSDAQRSAKQAALAAYGSQLALSSGRLHRMAADTECFVPVEPAAVAGTRLPWRPPAWLAPWLRLSVVDADGAASWRWSRAPLRRDALGAVHLVCHDRGDITPRFARLTLPLSSPWIFDHWGWCELD